MLLTARRAPGGEEVDHHPPAPVVVDVEACRRRASRPPARDGPGPPAGCRRAARWPARWWPAPRRTRRPARATTSRHDQAGAGGRRGGARRRRRRPGLVDPSVVASTVGHLVVALTDLHRLAARLARRRPRRRPRGGASAGACLVARATGADTGSIGLRRRPGKAASTVPSAMTRPPIHSHMTSGWTTTRTPTVWPASSSGARTQRQVHVLDRRGRHRRRADRLLRAARTG